MCVCVQFQRWFSDKAIKKIEIRKFLQCVDFFFFFTKRKDEEDDLSSTARRISFARGS